MPVPGPLTAARGDYAMARAATDEALWDVVQQEAALVAAERIGVDVDTARRNLETAQATLEAKRMAEADTKGLLQQQLAAWVPDTVSADEEVERLETRHPIVLLPVRVETRFSGTTLKVRIYPDEVFADTFEKRLTPMEKEWGQEFIEAGKTLAAWQRLLQKFSAERAAWIARALEKGRTEMRASDWTRPASAELLPDRFIVVGYPPPGAGGVVTVVGRPVEEPPALSLNPSAKDYPEPSANLPDIEPDLHWLSDFETAKAVGMALEVPVGPKGFDRLLVFGVKSSIEPADGSYRLSRLLDAHHYTRGFSLVRQGTPTNNTNGRAAGYPADDPDGEESFRIELGMPLDTPPVILGDPGTDGRRVARILGLDKETMGHIAGSDASENLNAETMNRALWPVTWGSFLKDMMEPRTPGNQPNFSTAAISETQDFIISYVRGRGPCPAFRIGEVPYGIQPVSSLERWQVASEGATWPELTLPSKLLALRGLWLKKALAGVPRVGKNPGDPDGDLLRIMGMRPSTREVRVRSMRGEGLEWNLFQLRRAPWGLWSAALDAMAARTFGLIGEPTWRPRVSRATMAKDAFLFRHPLVAPEPLAEDRDAEGQKLDELPETGPINYVDWIHTASIAELRSETREPKPEALLYHLLRHGMLLEYARAAHEKRQGDAADQYLDDRFVELVQLGPNTSKKTIWEIFAEKTEDPPGSEILVPMEEYLKKPGRTVFDPNPIWIPGPTEPYRNAIARLSQLSQAELDRLLSETLDLASHRLDAWITSLYTKRLLDGRVDVYASDGSEDPAPTASNHLGAFAWLEDVRPGTGQELRGGFMLAPSLAHAGAAAILRSGFLNYDDETMRRYAVDLSSRRVRAARALLDAVRSGVPAGELLGHRFERALHEAGRDRFIDPFRRLFPLVANKSRAESPAPASETVAARNVVDGLELRRAWSGERGDVLARLSVTPMAEEKPALETALNALDEAVDAVADLLTAESVFHLVRDNMAGAAAPLDALGEGARPPDPEVARTPHGGTGVTHRVAWVLKADSSASPWDNIPATRRAAAEPLLDAWVGELLGPPSAIKCWVSSVKKSPPADPVVTPSELKLRPLDFLELASEPPDRRQELERRVVKAAFEPAVPPDDVQVHFSPPAGQTFDPDTERTFPEALDFARQIASTLGAARALRPKDLLPLDHQHLTDADAEEDKEVPKDQRPDLEKDSQIDDGLLPAQLEALRAALMNATGESAIRDDLLEASAYLSGAFPDPWADFEALETAKLAVIAEIEARVAAVAEIEARVAAFAEIGMESENASDRFDRYQDVYRAVFGRSFLRLPRFSLPALFADELEKSASTLSVEVLGARPAQFLQQVARVRRGVAEWRKMWLYAEALFGNASKRVRPPAIDVAQIPHMPEEDWAGDRGAPAGARLSLLLPRFETADRPRLTTSVAGLVFDEWTELIPNAEEQTGIAFQFDNPAAEAPQAILVAVPPDPAKENWELADLIAILNETLDLAKIRGVDLELLGEIGQVLPAIYLGANPAGEAIATDFSGLLLTGARRVQQRVP
jgi:hypothetical protein